jgi:hypothetical protein
MHGFYYELHAILSVSVGYCITADQTLLPSLHCEVHAYVSVALFLLEMPDQRKIIRISSLPSKVRLTTDAARKY